ncbi:hypothetical protein D3C87_39100 [compost metagenome]
MKHLFLTIALFGLTLTGHAQLGGLKGKVTNSVKSKASSTVSSPGSTQSSERTDMIPQSSNGEPTSQEKVKSPAKEAIRQIDMIIMNAESDLKSNHCKGIRIEAMADYIAEIKRLDPAFKGLPKYEKDYKRYMDACSDEFVNVRAEEYFRKLSYEANSFRASERKYMEFNDSNPLIKKNFELKKEEYLKSPKQSAEVLKYITEIDKVYANEVPKLVNSISEQTRNTLITAVKYSDAGRKKADFIEKLEYTYDPEKTVSNMKRYSGYCEKALSFLLPGNVRLKEIKDSLDKLLPEIETYQKSGQFEKDKALKRKIIMDAVRCPKATNTDPALIAIVKRDFNTEHGTLSRISIVSNDWYIQKNDLGRIIEKKMQVSYVYSSDGKCLLNDGVIVCDYMGGGTYGKPYFRSYISVHHVQEMNCANVQK